MKKLFNALSLVLMLSMLLTTNVLAAVWTDQADYSPGSTVTISGDNSNDAGYMEGETVHVVVYGPNDYIAHCDSEPVASDGTWSCQVQLNNDESAVGSYSYTATGEGSGVEETGTFTDALQTATTVTSSKNPSTVGDSVTFTATVKSGNPAVTIVTFGDVKFGTGANCAGGFTELQGAQIVNSSGQVTYTTSSLPEGTTTIRACYLGYGSGSDALQSSNGTVTQKVDPVSADTTKPVIEYTLTPDAPDGLNGWYVTDVFVDWTVTDPESDVTIDEGCVDTTIDYDTTGVTLSCTASSAGGTAGPVTVTIKRDATKPEVSLVDGPANGGEYYYGFVPAAPTCDASDATSGLDGDCIVSGYLATVGIHTVTATATDMAGNQATDSATYTVLEWELLGFYRPVDMGDVWNTIKGGQTVPLKFNIWAGDTEIKDTDAIEGFIVTPAQCPGPFEMSTEPVEFTTTGGTSLRYDFDEGQFIQNWKTPKTKGVCYVVTMTTLDGSTLEANFMTK